MISAAIYSNVSNYWRNGLRRNVMSAVIQPDKSASAWLICRRNHASLKLVAWLLMTVSAASPVIILSVAKRICAA